ncbi:MAG TPA: bifunctional phosphopantothenoylcysteine decarboxylase/phosphopantothenate--cysteine ligase CoaBC [Solirubrobacteraceae bacterium]|jgi:phosphopantothenoylcysteine decarboxylase/phosphopantothenate--cysteine ligase
MARILLGVSGGIAAYKALELVRLLTKAGHAVRVVQTPTSERFVGRASFAALTGAPVLVDQFEPDPARGAFPGDPPPSHDPLSHLELVANADVFAIAPASANTIAKLANGLADNLLTNAALAATCPVLVAPAMNNHMWEHAATRANLQTLRERGVAIAEPGTGDLASKGEFGAGRLVEPSELFEAIEKLLPSDGGPRPLDGLTVLVSAGGTREPIDSVRFIGNRSSGRMGFALAEVAASLGAEVTVVAANVAALPRDPRVSYVDVETADQLLDALRTRFASSDVLLMAAAVVDFRPAAAHDGKLKKEEAQEEMSVALARTPDIVSTLAQERREGQTIVGFAAEHGAGALDHGRDKLRRKGLDAVVVNDISRSDIGFDAAANEVTIVTAEGETAVPRAPKPEVARAILDAVVRLRAGAVIRP